MACQDTRFPSDVLRAIALYIADTDTFFTYLDVLGDDDLLDHPLGVVRTLGSTCGRHKLWPHLVLRALPSIDVVADALHLFAHIKVSATIDLALIPHGSLHPHVTLAVSVYPSSPSSTWFATPVASFVDRLIMRMPNDQELDRVAAMLPHLPRLSTLDVRFDKTSRCSSTGKETVLAAVAASSVARMSLSRAGYLNSTMVGHLARWLETGNVSAFSLESTRFGADPDTVAAFLNALGRCTTLESLKWQQVAVAPNHGGHLVIPVNVVSLDLTNIESADVAAAFTSLASFLPRSQLQQLKVTRNTITQRLMAMLGRKGRPMRAVEGEEGDSAVDFYAALGQCRTLTKLSMADCPIHRRAELVIPAFVTSLTIKFTVPNEEAVAAVMHSLHAFLPHSNIVKLTLTWNNMSPGHVKSLVHSLRSSSTLRTLCFQRCNLTDEACLTLAELAMTAPSLHRLDLSGNGISDIGARAFVHAVECSTSLRTLNLASNMMGRDGGEALTLAVGRRQSRGLAWDVLNLCWNGPRDVEMLLPAFVNDCGIKKGWITC